MKGRLDAAGVRLVGVGHEDFGLEDFLKGNYFSGGRWPTDSWVELAALGKKNRKSETENRRAHSTVVVGDQSELFLAVPKFR